MSAQASLVPAGLTRAQFAQLNRLVGEYEGRSLGEMLPETRGRLQAVGAARERSALVNLRLAEAIVQAFVRAADRWPAVPELARPWLVAAAGYFLSPDDEEPDLSSPLGFEDDAEVLNACLRLAGLEELCLIPDEYDDL